jgi:hypothetical protein
MVIFGSTAHTFLKTMKRTTPAIAPPATFDPALEMSLLNKESGLRCINIHP